ncbi:MAG: roadblock/LC7 domain-containing protein, partial [Chthoniobacteraceae bacterium]
FDIFGDEENPHALAPRVVERPTGSSLMTPGLSSGMRVVRIGESGMVPSPSRTIPRNPTPIPIAATPPPPPRPEAPPAPKLPPLPPLVIPVRDIATGWPEPIKTEVSLLNGAHVSLPAADVNAGLSKGKVAFQWGQIRAWLSPSPSAPTLADESTELSLPLRVVAPAFLKHSKAAETVQPAKRKLAIDDTIPELFGGGPATPAAPVTPPAPAEPNTTVETPAAKGPLTLDKTATPDASAESSNGAVAEIKAVVPEPAPATDEPVFKITEKPAPAPSQPEPKSPPVVASVPDPKPAAPEAAPETKTENHPPAATLGQFFGEPEKSNWSPNEIVSNLVMHPDVEGAIVALHEGLVIAHVLPDSMKGEVFAAFLPQIFARLNQYSGEMKLGTISDLQVNASGRSCHIFRLGQVYFGALATPGRTLPTSELWLCANALAQN